MKTTLASIGTGALGIAILLALALIPVLLLQGGVWLSALLFPWLAAINALTLLVTLFALLPNAVFSSTPRFAGSGMMIVSYVFGATLWVWSLLLTYTLWGGFWLFIGLFMAGGRGRSPSASTAPLPKLSAGAIATSVVMWPPLCVSGS